MNHRDLVGAMVLMVLCWSRRMVPTGRFQDPGDYSDHRKGNRPLKVGRQAQDHQAGIGKPVPTSPLHAPTACPSLPRKEAAQEVGVWLTSYSQVRGVSLHLGSCPSWGQRRHHCLNSTCSLPVYVSPGYCWRPSLPCAAVCVPPNVA